MSGNDTRFDAGIPGPPKQTYGTNLVLPRYIALKTMDGRYLSALENGRVQLSDCLVPWDVIHAYRSVALQSKHGKWLCAESNGVLVADRPIPRAWEYFEVVPKGPGRFAFKGAHGRFICAEQAPDGNVVVNRKEAMGWETFEAVVVSEQSDAGFGETVERTAVSLGLIISKFFIKGHNTEIYIGTEGHKVVGKTDIEFWNAQVYGNEWYLQSDKTRKWLSCEHSLTGEMIVCHVDFPTSTSAIIVESCDSGSVAMKIQGGYIGVDKDQSVMCEKTYISTEERVIFGGGCRLMGCHGLYLIAASDGVNVNANGHADAELGANFAIEYVDGAVSIRTAQNKLLSANPDGSLTTNGSERGAWELFHPTLLTIGTAFKTHHGTYITAQPSGEAVCNRTTPREWEGFKVLEIGDFVHWNPEFDIVAKERVNLKSYHSKYVCCEARGLVANRDRASDWETFKLEYKRNGMVAIRTWKGTFLSVSSNGSIDVGTQYRGECEEWKIVRVAGGCAFMGVNGKYLCAETNGRLICDRLECRQWETFKIHEISRPEYSF